MQQLKISAFVFAFFFCVLAWRNTGKNDKGSGLCFEVQSEPYGTEQNYESLSLIEHIVKLRTTFRIRRNTNHYTTSLVSSVDILKALFYATASVV
jgi:hypothetical protein